LATSAWVNFKSFLIVNGSSGGNAYHDKKAIMNPKVEKKNVRPYLSTGLRIGILLAFPFIGLTSGAFQRLEIANIVGLMIEYDEKSFEDVWMGLTVIKLDQFYIHRIDMSI